MAESSSQPLDSSVCISPDTAEKLKHFRRWMAGQLEGEGLDLYLVPSADNHLNEYLPRAWQRREWISGFTGSAGDALIGLDDAWVFVDSRYHEQVEQEVDPDWFIISKLGTPDAPSLGDVLTRIAQEYGQSSQALRIGFDPHTVSVEQFQGLVKTLDGCLIQWVPTPTNGIDTVRHQSPWHESSPMPAWGESPLFSVATEYTGESTAEKIQRLQHTMATMNLDVLPIVKLDQLAWLLNCRGWDVDYNPVFIGYGVLTQHSLHVYTHWTRVPQDIQDSFHQDGICMHPYDALEEHLAHLPKNGIFGDTETEINENDECEDPLNEGKKPPRFGIDPRHTTMAMVTLLFGKNTPTLPFPWGVFRFGLSIPLELVECTHPIELMKARKNPTELKWVRRANHQASRAIIRFMAWLEEEQRHGNTLTEWDTAQAIERLYSQEPEYQGLSFNPITGAGANSSIVHYGTPSKTKTLEAGELFLIDSGAQYTGGTTDATRTVLVGLDTTATDRQKQCYTAVLLGHIRCSQQRFPWGTNGAQLDGITRGPMWDLGLDYGHGTGHGVGAFLNVHEGPNGIHRRANTPLEAGMVTSIEPGFYEPGWGGIRIENLAIVVPIPSESEHGSGWLEFEPIILVPVDPRLVDESLLQPADKRWLANYHQRILSVIGPTLSSAEKEWLQTTCDAVLSKLA